MYFIFLGKKSIAEVENFKLVCLALAALNNFCGDKIKISNKAISKLYVVQPSILFFFNVSENSAPRELHCHIHKLNLLLH